MYRFLCFILLAASMVAILVGCRSTVKNPSGMTAEETVEKYFDYWNEKDGKGMRSLEYENTPTGERQLDLLYSVKLNSCVERENIDKSNWTSAWYPNPYDFACVDANFTVDAKERSVLNGTYDYGFWLVKESKNSDWIIVAYGQG